MKILVYNWAGAQGATTLLTLLGYKHQEYYEITDVYELVKMFHQAGLNVMLPQPKGGVQTVAVDFEKWFSAR